MELAVLFILLVLVLLVFGTAAWASVRAAPFVPLGSSDVKRMIALAQLRDGETLCDLGCGDGRILFAAARAETITVIGYELSVVPYLVAKCRWLFFPDRQRIEIKFADFLHADLRTIDVFTCFLTPMAMKRLKPLFERDAKDGARIVSYAFPVLGWQADIIDKQTSRETRIYRYTIRRNRQRG